MDKKIKSYIKLLESYTKKKVILKEADEASKNQAINNLQFVSSSLSNVISKIQELKDIPILTEERTVTLNKMITSLTNMTNRVDSLIEEITGTETEEQEESLDEDVSMSTDDIIKNPQVVKKLSDNKVDVKVKDKNMKSSSSSSTF